MVAEPILEQLLNGKKESIEFYETTHEKLLHNLNNLIIKMFPGGWAKGEFIDTNDDYLIYDLHISGLSLSGGSIRIFDFGDKFKLIRM